MSDRALDPDTNLLDDKNNIINPSTEEKQDVMITSLQIMDDWDESDRAKVNPVVGQAGVEAGSGVDTVKTQRVSLATDIPLPSGTNNIGSVDIIDNDTDRKLRINPGSGAIATDETFRLVGPQFIGSSLDTSFWTLANNGTASGAAVAGGLVTLTSGTDNSGSGSIQTVQHARFLFVNPNLYRGAVRVTALSVAENTRRWGAMTVTAGSPWTLDGGFYFSLDGNDVLSINYKTSGSGANTVNSGSFNGDVTSFTMDTDVHAYEILYYEMEVWFTIDGVLIHKVTPTTAKLTDDFNLHAAAESVNSASGTSSGVLEVFAASILRIGAESTTPICFHSGANGTNVLKLSPGKLHRIVVNEARTNNVITIYDNTSATGTQIGVINSANEGSFEYQCEFQVGLTVVQGGGTASDITIVYD